MKLKTQDDDAKQAVQHLMQIMGAPPDNLTNNILTFFDMSAMILLNRIY